MTAEERAVIERATAVAHHRGTMLQLRVAVDRLEAACASAAAERAAALMLARVFAESAAEVQR